MHAIEVIMSDISTVLGVEYHTEEARDTNKHLMNAGTQH